MHCGCNINLPDEIDINSPIVIEPDEINSADATLSSDINGAEDDITTKIVAANECWNEAVSEVLPSVIIIQKYTRMYIAKKNSMRGGAYHRRANGRHTGCNDCNLQVHDNSDVSKRTISHCIDSSKYTTRLSYTCPSIGILPTILLHIIRAIINDWGEWGDDV